VIFRQLNPGPCRTYLIGSERSREVALVDPVLDRVPDYLTLLDREGWRLALIIDTHTHADHISGGPALCDHTRAPYAMHHLGRPHCPTQRVRDGDAMTVGDVTIRCLHTPGHTNDSLTLVAGDRLLTGDFLFIGDAGAGRTDLPTGDPGQHFDSLRKLKDLPGTMETFPAHDYHGKVSSTLERERRENPRLGFTSRDEYVRWLESLATPAPDWMKKVVEANYACTQTPGSVWIPVDLPACQMKGPLTLGVDGQPVSTITAEEARRRIDAGGTGVLVLDVRNPDEYAGELGHIPGSIVIPVPVLAQRLAELEAHSGREIITVCRSGGRSHTAAGILMQAKFPRVVSMEGGMTRWRALGYPAETTPGKT
jgi:glyoxylase-like metal-dependent hydrolase (beta-lactamase superfamily II)/rhodanese-related sulfurtransferase